MRESELIINPDGSVYHLALLPEEIADYIIFVGDQNRVDPVSKHFDTIEVKKSMREFVTHTGRIGPLRISVMSTGIGTDNIDIVMNEIDALANIDFSTRTVKEKIKSLTIIRIGTSGSVHPEIKLDDMLVSRYAIGTDSLGQYYGVQQNPHELLPPWSYLVKGYDFDLGHFHQQLKHGITLTAPGFYAAQGRLLRMEPEFSLAIEDLQNIMIEGLPVTNIEMETSGIYLLAEKMGHKAISFNAILAERLNLKFSKDPKKTVKKLIEATLEWVCKL